MSEIFQYVRHITVQTKYIIITNIISKCTEHWLFKEYCYQIGTNKCIELQLENPKINNVIVNIHNLTPVFINKSNGVEIWWFEAIQNTTLCQKPMEIVGTFYESVIISNEIVDNKHVSISKLTINMKLKQDKLD